MCPLDESESKEVEGRKGERKGEGVLAEGEGKEGGGFIYHLCQRFFFFFEKWQ